MRRICNAKSRARERRSGLSAFESLACFAALVGGVVLGAVYLGIDVKKLALKVVGEATVVEDDQDAAADPEQAAQPASDESASSPANRTATQASDGEALQTNEGRQAAASQNVLPANEFKQVAPPEATRPVATQQTNSSTSQFSNWVASLNEESMLTDAQRKTLTSAYWQALTKALDAESSGRDAVLTEGNGLQLFEYLAHRQAQHQRTSDTILSLSNLGVEASVVAFAKRAVAWHQQGASLFDRAKDLLTDAPTAQLTGPFAQSWQSAATQHRMEERLLIEKRKAVANFVEHYDGPTTSAALE